MAISKFIFLGAGLAVLALFFQRSAQIGIGKAFGETGSGIGSLGSGFSSLGSGIGTGLSKLLNPFFTVADLFGKFQGLFPSESTNQQRVSGEPRTTETSTGKTIGLDNPTYTVNWGGNTGVDLPLSPAAVKYYGDLGVSVKAKESMRVPRIR
jgi:hypothetical protein